MSGSVESSGCTRNARQRARLISVLDGQVRLRATCVENGVTVGGQSDYFTVPADGVVRVDEIRFDGAAPVPERLTISASTTTLTEPGQVLPLTVLALYPDGTNADVTVAAAGTNYVVSNPAVATLSADGELTAVASGTVIVSALRSPTTVSTGWAACRWSGPW